MRAHRHYNKPVDNLPAFSRLLIRDYILLGLAGGLVLGLWRGEGWGAGFAAACFWLGLNTAILTWLLGALLAPGKPQRLFVFLIACAKIPAAYLLLFWLFSRDFLEPIGLAAGVATLPVVILAQGLLSLYSSNSRKGFGKTRPMGARHEEEKA